MFHKSNLGSYGTNLPSDLDGYVPERGDHWNDFRWDHYTTWKEESWSNFIQECEQKTSEAEREMPTLFVTAGQHAACRFRMER